MLPRLDECRDWARRLAGELTASGMSVTPDPPHTPTFQLYAGVPADEVNRRLLDFLEQARLQPCGPWSDSEEPGRARTELVCSLPALEHDPAQVARWLAEVVHG